jgi:translocation and assembly module TamA
MDRALRGEIERAIGDSKTLPESRFEARRRAREAAADALALLRSEGYYLPTVSAEVADGPPLRALVRIEVGPRFRFKSTAVDWRGPPPEAGAQAAARKGVDLADGAPGRAADVIAAEGRAVAALEKLGYADAKVEPRQVVVDDADQTVRPVLVIAAGERVRLDGVQVITKGRTNPAWVRGLAPWKSGDVYDSAKVAKLERRLLDVGVYDSVTVALAPKGEATGALRPVIVNIADRPKNTIELGASYSNAPIYYTEAGVLAGDLTGQGSGVDGKWITYNRLRRADTITLTGQIYDIQQKFDVDLALPGWRRPDQVLRLGAGVTADQTPAFRDIDGGVRLTAERDFTKTTYVTLGGALDYTDTREETAINLLARPVGQDLRLFIVTGLAGFALDRSDNYLNPTRGWQIQARIEPTAITGDESLAYLKAVGQASAYAPLDSSASTVIAGRLRLGSILGGQLPAVPADRRFFAGGGGSVRGYGYQAVGPRLSDNTPFGGLSLFESSFEVRRRLTDQWGLVAFADAGSVGEGQLPSFSAVSTGVGLGLRYNLGFAPFRIDVATPLNPRKGDAAVQVYVSIGQSF